MCGNQDDLPNYPTIMKMYKWRRKLIATISLIELKLKKIYPTASLVLTSFDTGNPGPGNFHLLQEFSYSLTFLFDYI
ncbi:Uncharacterized protein APZ42_008166 [Daphnia magna]|uniref:Uncharacterized protein n=1 Tax=Daphnia magna TaxID=35525 RepID=A0A164EU25_9CRUS|nr:Uncharacterized protein APZ42_008166 [Daphnia magna]